MNEWVNEWKLSFRGSPSSGLFYVLGANAKVLKTDKGTYLVLTHHPYLHCRDPSTDLHGASYSQQLTWLLACGGLELSAKTGWLWSCLPGGTPAFQESVGLACPLHSKTPFSCLLLKTLYGHGSSLSSPLQTFYILLKDLPLEHKSQNLCSFWYYILLKVVNWGWLSVWIWRRQRGSCKEHSSPILSSLSLGSSSRLRNRLRH